MGFDWNQRAIKTEQLKLARKTKMVKRKIKTNRWKTSEIITAKRI